MRPSLHTRQSQPTRWSSWIGMFARIGESNPGLTNEALAKEAGR